MSKKVQISKRLFLELVRYFCLEQKDNVDYDYITDELTKKLNNLVMHENYTAYKTAKTEEERKELKNKLIDSYLKLYLWNDKSKYDDFL